MEQARLKRGPGSREESDLGLRLQALRQILHKDAAVLVYSNTNWKTFESIRNSDPKMLVFVVTKKSIQAREISMGASALEQKRPATCLARPEGRLGKLIESFRLAVTKPGGSEKTGRQLHELLISPLMPALKGIKSLVIIPEERLLYTPFEKLKNHAGVSLGKRYQLRYSRALRIRDMLN